RRRRAAAELLLGDDDLGRGRTAQHRPGPGDRARGDDPPHGALAERHRRRAARRPRPAGEGAARGAHRDGRAGGNRRLMARFALRRLVGMVLVLFAVSVIVFAVFNLIPNSPPAQRLAGKNANPRLVKSIEEEWGFDESLPEQYVTMMKKAFGGEL